MARFRCPECGEEAEVGPMYGEEVVAVYCLTHTGGPDAHTRPVYMMRVPEEATGIRPEPVLAGSGRCFTTSEP
jgi:hypothetical protein